MIRLDLYLNEFGFTKSRQKAKILIESGCVYVNSQKISKPSHLVNEEEIIDVKIINDCPYVSRGGLKLEKVLNDMKYDLQNKIALDIGASTGGFTDCLLKHGAKLVYAVDSGVNQLDESLIDNEKVISIEKYNARNISFDLIGECVDIITIDVSFISQTLILPAAIKLLKPEGAYISLIKPQFEAGKDKIGKGGIVKKSKDRFLGVKKVLDSAIDQGLSCIYFSASPILGGDGNIEFLAVFSKNGSKSIDESEIKKIVLEN